MTDSIASFKKTMSQFTTGIAIVTMRGKGEDGGMTLNSFNSVSLNPPLVSICVTKGTHSHGLIADGGRFCVNILAGDQDDLARRFATQPAEERFLGLETTPSPSGLPIIAGVLAWLDVRVVHRYEGGDHTIFIGEVEAMDIERPDAEPLVYFRSAYRTLPAGNPGSPSGG